jgi:hypothetical protein
LTAELYECTAELASKADYLEEEIQELLANTTRRGDCHPNQNPGEPPTQNTQVTIPPVATTFTLTFRVNIQSDIQSVCEWVAETHITS